MGKTIHKRRRYISRSRNKIDDFHFLKIPKNKREAITYSPFKKKYLFGYSTVTEWINYRVNSTCTTYTNKYNSLICKFTLSFKSSTLTKTSHYSGYQEKLYDEVKRLKDDLGLGYRRISYVLYDKGYRGIRKNSILRYNYIYSIYHKGKIREKRINRDFKTVIKDIMIYESF